MKFEIKDVMLLLSPLVGFSALFSSIWIAHERRIEARVSHRNLALFAYRLAVALADLTQARIPAELQATEHGLDAIDLKTVTPSDWVSGLIDIRFFWIEAKSVLGTKYRDDHQIRSRAARAMNRMDAKLWKDGVTFDEDKVARHPGPWRWIRSLFQSLRRPPVHW